MNKLMRFFMAGIMLLSLSSLAFCEDLEAVGAKFYNDLADIIENNMNNPDQCVSEIDAYCHANQDALAKVRQLSEMGKKRAQSGQYPTMSEQEAGRILAENKFARALNRFSDAFSTFSMENSEQASQIAEMVKE